MKTKPLQVDLFNESLSLSASFGRAERAETFMTKALEIIRRKEGIYISGEYKNAKSTLIVRCKNDHTFDTHYDRLSQGKWCQKCPRPNRVKYTIGDMHRIARERGGECLSDKYLGMEVKLEWSCPQHGSWWAAPNNVIYGTNGKGTWCPKCGEAKKGREPTPAQVVIGAVDARGGRIIEGIENYTTLKDTRLTIQCGNGHDPWSVTAASIVHQGSWCPHCPTLQGEVITRAILEETFNAKFPRVQPHFLAVQGRRGLQLDGYCVEHPVAFEYQGPYHDLPEQKLRDERKRQLCAENGVTLIEVLYVSKPTIDCLLPVVTRSLAAAGIDLPVRAPTRVLFPIELEELRALAASKDLVLFSTEYLGEHSLHKWKCREPAHPPWEAPPYNIRKDIGCAHCAGVAKKGGEFYREFGAANNLRFVGGELGMSKNQQWHCRCGFTFEASIPNVRQRIKRGAPACPRCAGTDRRTTIEDVRVCAMRRHWTVNDDRYVDAHAPMSFRCSQGHDFVRNWNKVQQGCGCTFENCSDNRSYGTWDRRRGRSVL